MDPDQLPGDDSIDEPASVVDEVEPSILDDAHLGEVDLARMLESEAAHGSDREAGGVRHRSDATGVPHIRKTPNRVSGIGAWREASRPSARMRRVSHGSMTPSSQRRAVAK